MKNGINIGVYSPISSPLSVRIYSRNICHELLKSNARIWPFDGKEGLPSDVDLFWDPTETDGRIPPRWLLKTKLPVVSTVHGFATAYLAGKLDIGVLRRLGDRFVLFKRKSLWKLLGKRVSAVITVSDYAKQEITKHLSIESARVTVAYHGVGEVFAAMRASSSDQFSPGYLLHVSSPQAKKNVQRVVQAYEMLQIPSKPRLLLVVPGGGSSINVPGVEVIDEPLEHQQLAPLYAGAEAFIFPSLHETFGLPILEAMAAGCPVLTSDSTACAEVAGTCAQLVNPWSTANIAAGLHRLLADSNYRRGLTICGKTRAASFTWERSAAIHMSVFNTVLANSVAGMH